MAISQDFLHELIEKDFPDSNIEITDLAGDGDHYKLVLRSARFIGISIIEQHKMVYKALEGYMGTKLHALALETHPK